MTKVIRSGGSLAHMLRKLGRLGKLLVKKAVTDLAVPVAKDILSRLVSSISSNAASNAINKFGERVSRKGAIRARRGFTLFISNEDMADIIKTVESLEKSSLLIDDTTEAVKHEIK